MVEVRGDEVMAVFASPAHAVRAGVELVALCEEEIEDNLPLLAGVGIETGPAVAVGDGFRGAALNTAARLCSAAGAGEVLLPEALADRVAPLGGIVFTPRGPAELKGFDKPVELVAANPEPRARPATAEALAAVPVELQAEGRLAGRRRELAWLRGVWRRARRGFGSVVFVSGPAGIGKTRLAAELAVAALPDAGRIAYVGAGGAAGALAQAALAEAAEADLPTLVVIDDFDAIGEGLVTSLADPAIATRPVIVLALAREPERMPGVAQLLENGWREGGGQRPRAARLRRRPGHRRRLRGGVRGRGACRGDRAGLGRRSLAGARAAGRLGRAEGSRRLAAAAEWLATERHDRSAESRVREQRDRAEARRLYAEPRPRGRSRDVSLQGARLVRGGRCGSFFFGRERLVGELAARTVGVGLLAVVGAFRQRQVVGNRSGSAAVARGRAAAGQRALDARLVLRPGEHPVAGARMPPVRERGRATGSWSSSTSSRSCSRSASTKRSGQLFVVGSSGSAADPDRTAVVDRRCAATSTVTARAYPELARRLAENQVLVGPMTADELRRAVELPAEARGVRGRRRPRRRARRRGGGASPDALPLLSTSLVELWFDAGDGRLRLESHQRLGGVRGAVAPARGELVRES